MVGYEDLQCKPSKRHEWVPGFVSELATTKTNMKNYYNTIQYTVLLYTLYMWVSVIIKVGLWASATCGQISTLGSRYNYC